LTTIVSIMHPSSISFFLSFFLPLFPHPNISLLVCLCHNPPLLVSQILFVCCLLLHDQGYSFDVTIDVIITLSFH
jgi:hypothetical protein